LASSSRSERFSASTRQIVALLYDFIGVTGILCVSFLRAKESF
jgi:hypothetical protein